MAACGALPNDHPTVKKIVEQSRSDDLKDQQKILNQKKKAQRKVEAIRKELLQGEERFQDWKKSLKATIKKEEERHAEKQEQLRADLLRAEKEAEEGGQTAQEISDDEKDSSDPEDKNMKDEALEEMKKQMMAMQQQFFDASEEFNALQRRNYELEQKMATMLVGEEKIPSIPSPPMTMSPTIHIKEFNSMKPFRKASTNVRSDPYVCGSPIPPKTKDKGKGVLDKPKEKDKPDGPQTPASAKEKTNGLNALEG